MEEPIPCRRCLLKDMNRDEYFAGIYEYIQALPPEQKVSPELYAQRLALCRSCEELTNGMCRHCGCFVEVRAIKALGRCPAAPAKW